MQLKLKIKYTTATAAATIAAVTFASYLCEARLFANIQKNFLPMPPTTAVLFIIMGLVLIFHEFVIRKKTIDIITSILIILVMIFSILELPDWLFNIDLNLEHILLPDFGNLGKFAIARMSPLSGVCFFIMGVSIILLLLRKNSIKIIKYFMHFACLLTCIVCVTSLTILLSYLHDIPLLYNTSAIPMALSTAISFLLLSIALLSSFPRDIFPVNLFLGHTFQARLMRAFIPLTIVVVVATDVLIHNVLIYYLKVHESIIITSYVLMFIMVTAAIAFIVSRTMGVNINYYLKELKQAKSNILSISRFPQENPSPVLRISKFKKLLYVNKAAFSTLNHEKLIIGADFQYWTDIIDEAFRTNKMMYREDLLSDNLWFGWRFVPIIKEGYLNIYGTNITKRKLTEQKLKKSFEDIVLVISNASEKKDPYTAGHQFRVAQLAVAVAEKMKLSEEQINTIYYGSIIHDLGKLYIPSDILNRPGNLTDSEMRIIKEHPQTGYDIVKHIEFAWPIKNIILHHHEKLDGSGYPDGLKGKKINIECRIVCVADVVEAMNAHRPYRPSLGLKAALAEIKKNKGVLYDPEVVDTCIELFEKDKFKFDK